MTTINLKLFAQGAYIGNGEMAAEQSATVKVHGESEVLETIETTLATDGALSVNATTEGTVYLSVRTQNTLEVFTASTVELTGGVVNYDFTDADSKAYGSNQVEVESGVFALYSGDVDGDGVISQDDVQAVSDDSDNSVENNALTDLNSDGITDLSDVSTVTNNVGKEVAVPTAAERIGLPNPRL